MGLLSAMSTKGSLGGDWILDCIRDFRKCGKF